MNTPSSAYRDVALLIEPEVTKASEWLASWDWFRQIVDAAYQLGWEDHEQTIIDRLSDHLKRNGPPEVYP